jgi:hypothetical protein
MHRDPAALVADDTTENLAQNERERKRLAFETAVATRQFEIELVWKRGTYFFGFIAAAFPGHTNLLTRDSSPILALLVSAFGLVCSIAWSLANRGSKYWQEHWERRVRRLEPSVLHERLFRGRDQARSQAAWWFQPRQYSVSKLTMALSDFTCVIWLALMGFAAVATKSCWSIVVPLVSIVFIGAILVFTRTGPDQDEVLATDLQSPDMENR